jgi:hydrogenase maturation protease
MTRQNKPLIVGIGNPLRGDDGVGQEILHRLSKGHMREMFDMLTTHQLLPENAEALYRYQRVIFVDACVDLPAGEWRLVAVEANPKAMFSGHVLEPCTLLALTRSLYGAVPQAWCLRIGAEQFELRQSLSTKVLSAIEACVPGLVALESVQGASAHA